MSGPDREVDVLMAEDEEDDYFLARDAFRECRPGLRLSRVRDGQILMDYLSSFPPPKLVLLDLQMPRKSGFEALAEIKAHPDLRVIPVIIFTSSNNPALVRSAYEMGANSFIRKPVGYGPFVKAMSLIERYWLRSTHPPVIE